MRIRFGCRSGWLVPRNVDQASFGVWAWTSKTGPAVTIKAAATADERLTILIMGTSMSSGYGQGKGVDAVGSNARCICARACSHAPLSSARSASCALVKALTAASIGDQPSPSVFSATEIEAGVG